MGLFDLLKPNVEKMQKKKDVTALIKALKHSNLLIRLNVAAALGKIGDARAVEPLIAVLKDSDSMESFDASMQKSIAARALGKIGDARAVEPLIAALKDSNPVVRESAAEALREIGDARAVELLSAALTNEQGPGISSLNASSPTGVFANKLDQETCLATAKVVNASEQVSKELKKLWQEIAVKKILEAEALIGFREEATSEKIERYCKFHKPTVKIHRMPKPPGSKMLLLACEHTFLKGVFECNQECVYAVGAQMGIETAAKMEAPVSLNPDGTIRLDALKLMGFVDYTS